MRVNKALLFASIVSLSYNAVVLFSVFLNLDWVHSRAAGGQFNSFPTLIRIIYLFMGFLTMALLFWLFKFYKGISSLKNSRFVSFLKYLFGFSTFMQLISRSTDERWNAIPAFILALTFFNLSKVKQSGD
ncbi:MAG: hypothetical protein FGM47_03935 [Candidatus Nanopelagicaceae bacterium]|nr:hypothetical protein [Candidatus Nanopelagicaceae bacterium]